MNHDAIESLAFFVMEHTGTVMGCWRGHMSVMEQRELFGCYFGAGELAVCGSTQTICEDGKFLTNWSDL